MTRVRSASLAVLCSVLILAGCGVDMKQGSQARNNRGVPQGPGALTGKDGEFTIFRIDKSKEEVEAEEAAKKREEPEEASE